MSSSVYLLSRRVVACCVGHACAPYGFHFGSLHRPCPPRSLSTGLSRCPETGVPAGYDRLPPPGYPSGGLHIEACRQGRGVPRTLVARTTVLRRCSGRFRRLAHHVACEPGPVRASQGSWGTTSPVPTMPSSIPVSKRPMSDSTAAANASKWPLRVGAVDAAEVAFTALSVRPREPCRTPGHQSCTPARNVLCAPEDGGRARCPVLFRAWQPVGGAPIRFHSRAKGFSG